MTKLKALLEMFIGTMNVAPVAVGVTHAVDYGCMRKASKSIVYADCDTYECEDDGSLGSYCYYPCKTARDN